MSSDEIKVKPNQWTNRILGMILGAMIAQLGGGIWWASATNTKVDFLVSNQASRDASWQQLATQLANHEARLQVLDATLTPRIAALEQRVNALEARRP